MTTGEPDRRIRSLLAAATAGDPEPAAAAWRRWRELLPDLDLIDGPEISLVPAVPEDVRREDPDHGRLRGLGRRATTHAIGQLTAAAHRQEALARADVRSTLTGGAAAALAYPATARWTTPTAELEVTRDALAGAGVTSLSARDRALGRTAAADDSAVVLRWRHPERSPRRAVARERVRWQGRELFVAPAHIVAYHCLLHGLLPHRPGQAAAAQALLDLHLLAELPHFDTAAFQEVVRRGGWRDAFARHGRSWGSALPDRDRELLTGTPGQPEPPVWDRWQSATIPLARTAVRWLP